MLVLSHDSRPRPPPRPRRADLLLREHPEGLSEYQLIQLLKARHSTHIPHRELADKLVLFRTHFLLFNALYHLRDHLWAEREARRSAR